MCTDGWKREWRLILSGIRKKTKMKFSHLLMRLRHLTTVILAVCLEVVSSEKSEEELLLDHLFRGYNPSARPVINSSSTVQVKLRFSLLQIQDLNVRSQILTTTGLLILDWNDERLTWTNDVSDLEEVVVYGGNIWRPEFAVINGAESIYGEYTEFQATVRSDGSIRWEPGGVFKTMCSIDISFYPFDEQTCHLVFGAWSYYTTKMNLTTDATEIHLDTYEKNGEWEILGTAAVRNEFHFKCCPHQRFSNIQFRLELRRRHTFYVMNVILPGIFTSAVLLSLFFCVPSQKVHIGVAALLSFRLFLVNVADTIPRTSDHVPLLGIYLTCTTAISTLAMLATVLVANLHNTRDSPVPRWMQALFYVDRLLCLCRRAPSAGGGSQVHAGIIHGQPNENGNASSAADRKMDRYRVVTLLNPLAFKTHDDEGRLTRTNEGQWAGRGQFDFPSSFTPPSVAPGAGGGGGGGGGGGEETETRGPNYNREWVEVAAVCDRFFFWLCLVFIVITTFLLLHPLVTLKLFGTSPTAAAAASAASNDSE